MIVFRRMFFAAVLAGLAAGMLMAGLQQWKLVPLIQAAEAIEIAEPHVHPDDAAVAPHVHPDEAWAPQPGLERIGYTVLADVLLAMGFSLGLVGVSVISGIPISVGNGVLWGLAGFLAFSLAPAFGLPPELPGMATADLGARQLWWLGTAAATAGAFLVIAKLRSWPAIGIGALLILVPQLAGAPAPPDIASAVPAPLAAEFAAASLGVSAVFWLVLGPLLGWLLARQAIGDAVPETQRRASA